MVKVIGVRFRKTGKIYFFAPGDLAIEKGQHVIVETARGVEYGSVVLGIREVADDEITPPLKNVIRIATEEDDRKEEENREKEKNAFKICQEKIQKHGLEMKLIDAEYTFDNNKVLFYFTADGRIDDILVKPTWENVEDIDKYKMVIEIDPGTAFGTGLHETTQLCIRQLRKYITNDTNLLDVGCGSGILSIIGRKLGAKNAFGIDIDEAAVTASIENAKVNGVDNNIEFIEGNIIDDKEIKDKAGYGCYDIVVANILADIIIPLSKVIAPHLKRGGLFITSGIIYNKEADVVKAIEENEQLEVKEITRQKDWVSVTAIRK